MLDLGSYSLRQSILEIKYKENYALWDRAGRLWALIGKDFPSLKLMTGQPNTTQFSSGHKHELTVEVGRLSFVAHQEKSEAVCRKAAKFAQLVVQSLEIREFTRIGFRQIFERKFLALESAVEEFSELNILKCPTGKHFGIQRTEPISPDFSLRWSDGAHGVNVRLSAKTLKAHLDVAVAHRGEFREQSSERHVVIFDIDYFIDDIVSASEFSPKLWLENASRVVRRDAGSFVSEMRK